MVVAVDFVHVPAIETEEVDEFAGGIDFRLEAGFGLVEHGCGVEGCAVGACEEFCGAEEDCSAFFVWGAGPCVVCGYGGVGGLCDFFVGCDVYFGEDVAVVVGDYGVLGVSGEDFLAVDDDWYFDGALVELVVEFVFEEGFFW